MKESNAPSLGRTPAQKFFDKWQGLIYLIPWIIGFVVFKAIPFGQSLYYSFTDMNFFNGIHEYGVMNYVTAFSDAKITKALITTFKYAFITVPLKLIFALFIAYILNFKIACVNLFRTVYYIPSILGGSVAIAVLWKAVFRDDGLVNTIIRAITFGHAQGPSWLSDPNYALWIICFLRIWQFGSAMVLFLAALKGVPADLYEAATIDGATRFQRIIHINIPAIMPTIIIMLIMTLGGVMNLSFEKVLLMQTDSNTAVSEVISTYVYKLGIQKAQYSLSTAVGLFNNAINLILLVAVNKISSKLSETSLW